MNAQNFTFNTGNFFLDNLIAWVIIGFLAGSIISLIDRRSVEGGYPITALTGILGALIGGFLSVVLFGMITAGLDKAALILSAIGGLIFPFIQRTIAGGRAYPTQERTYPGSSVFYSQVYPSREPAKDYQKQEEGIQEDEDRQTVFQKNPLGALQEYLKGTVYPATREDLIRNSLRMGADNRILYIFEQLEDKTYMSPIEVNEDLGRILKHLGR